MIKRIKRRKNSIKMIIGIYYGNLDFLLFLGGHIVQE